MTYEQFNFWLQGYIDGIGDIPSKEQWLFIVEKQKTIFPIYNIPWTYDSTTTISNDANITTTNLNGNKSLLNG